MAIKIDCPRCRKPLSVPRKKAGGYAHCPECNGRFWVPEHPAQNASTTDTGTLAPPAAPPSPTAPPVRPPAGKASSTPSPPPPISAVASGHAVARFIPAEAAQSKLEIAENGELPNLHLQEGDKKKMDDERNKGTSIHPLLLFALLCLSVVLSIFAVLYEPALPREGSLCKKEAARVTIDSEYLSNVGSDEPSKPYQVLLREALLAQRQKNPKKEERLYRRVLRMLRAERPDEARGLTGSRGRDEKLRRQLSILLEDQ